GRPYRFSAYALCLTAGLLKYYPLILLSLLAREGRRAAARMAIAGGLLLVGFAAYFRPELGRALGNIPAASHFADSFSAVNLPFGFAEALGEGFSRSVIALLLLSALAGIALARTLRTVDLIDHGIVDWSTREIPCLAIGAMVVVACFFAG